MGFLFPRLFPFDCSLIIETETNPSSRTTDQLGDQYPSGGSPYHFNLTLEELMFLVWKLKDVSAEGTLTENSPTFLDPPEPPGICDINGNSFSPYPVDNDGYAVDKMSEIICFSDSFRFLCAFPTSCENDEGLFDFYINSRYPVYIYEDEYYIAMNCAIGISGMATNVDPNPCDGSITFDIGPFNRTITSLKSFYPFTAAWTNNLDMTVSLLSERTAA